MKPLTILPEIILTTVFLIDTINGTELLQKLCNDLLLTIDVNYSLCFISDVPMLETYSRDCLAELNFPLEIINPEAIEEYQKEIFCSGYLVISNNMTFLKNIFNYHRRHKFRFRVHKKIIIFFKGIEDFMVSPFSYVANVHDNDILVINYLLPSFHICNITTYKSNLTAGCSRVLEQDFVGISSVRTNSSYQVSHYNNKILLENFSSTLLPWRPNFRERNDSFKVAAFNCPPYVYVDNRTNEVYDGIEFELLNLLTDKWPIKYNVYQMTPYMNMYNLIMKNVHHEINDMAICSIWLKATSVIGLDYTIPYLETCATFLVPKPREITPTWFVYYPVHWITWIFTMSVTFIVAILMNLFSTHTNFKDFSYCLLQSLRIVSNGGIDAFPKKSIITFILILWLMVSLLLTTGYSAGFSSALTLPKLLYTKTLQDMVDQDISWIGSDFFVTKDLVASNSPASIQLSKRFIFEANRKEINIRIKTNKIAIPSERLNQLYVTDSQNFDDYAQQHLKVLSECYLNNALVFILNMNSPYKEILDKRVLQINEYGLTQIWINNIIRKQHMSYMFRFFSNNDASSTYMPLNMVKMQGIFYFLIMCLALSCIVFGLEIYYAKYIKTK